MSCIGLLHVESLNSVLIPQRELILLLFYEVINTIGFSVKTQSLQYKHKSQFRYFILANLLKVCEKACVAQGSARDMSGGYYFSFCPEFLVFICKRVRSSMSLLVLSLYS